MKIRQGETLSHRVVITHEVCCSSAELIPSLLVCSENKCTLHVALPKWPINLLQPDRQRRQQALRAYCPNIYILCTLLDMPTIIVYESFSI